MRVDNIQHDILMDRLEDRPGTDGRNWDDQLIAAEMLSDLDPIARWVFLLHLLEDRSFLDVAKALRLTQTSTYRAYRRALDQLRLRAGLELDPDDALARHPGSPRPSSGWYARSTTTSPFTGGCPVAPSSARNRPVRGPLCAADGAAGHERLHHRADPPETGRLVHATPEETLAHLRRPPDQLDGGR